MPVRYARPSEVNSMLARFGLHSTVNALNHALSGWYRHSRLRSKMFRDEFVRKDVLASPRLSLSSCCHVLVCGDDLQTILKHES